MLCICPSAVFTANHCEGSHVHLCKPASKVESIGLESGHCWINWRDAECDWLRGYDVTFVVWNPDDWDQPGGDDILKVQGSAPKKTLDEESSKSPICAQRDGCYHVFLKKQTKKKRQRNEAAIQAWQNALRAHRDPLKAIMKRDANLISHLGSYKPNVTGSCS